MLEEKLHLTGLSYQEKLSIDNFGLRRSEIRISNNKQLKYASYEKNWAKIAIFELFLGQKGEIQIFWEEHFQPFFLRPKMSFYEKNQKDPMTGF